MKARPGLTLIELMLAGAILGMLAFGAIWGMMHIVNFVERRGELLAADGYCWDVAWAIFNCDYNSFCGDGGILKLSEEDLNAYQTLGIDCPYPARPLVGPAYLEIKGTLRKKNTGNWDSDYDFLSHLPAFEENPPVCYIILSNRYDAVNFPDKNGYDEDGGLYISVNLEWGPRGQRRYLMPRPETTQDDIEKNRVFNHPITLFRSKYRRSPLKQ